MDKRVEYPKQKKPGVIEQTLPFKDGLLMSVAAIRDVCYDLLSKHGFRFVLTIRFNQDIVENRFSCIRGKGRNNDSRKTLEYETMSHKVSETKRTFWVYI